MIAEQIGHIGDKLVLLKTTDFKHLYTSLCMWLQCQSNQLAFTLISLPTNSNISKRMQCLQYGHQYWTSVQLMSLSRIAQPKLDPSQFPQLICLFPGLPPKLLTLARLVRHLLKLGGRYEWLFYYQNKSEAFWQKASKLSHGISTDEDSYCWWLPAFSSV